MKAQHSYPAVLILALACATSAFASNSPQTTLVPVRHVYVPRGFDANDNTQIVVEGYLPNLCYQTPTSKAKVSGRTITITVSAMYGEPAPQKECPQAIVPFLESVSVGALNPGQYRVIVNAGSHFERRSRVSVAEAPSTSVDDYIYANVDYVERKAGSRRIVLHGYNPSECFVFDRMEFVSNDVDTYSVLPIMKQIRPDCPMKMVPFQIDAVVPDTLTPSSVLLHVRVMNGRSVNTLFEND